MNRKNSSSFFGFDPLKTFLILGIASFFYNFQILENLDIKAYQSAVFFIFTIIAIVLNVTSTLAISLISFSLFLIFNPFDAQSPTLVIQNSLSEFDNSLLWLIVIAFILASSFSSTGLGKRVALLLLSKFGTSSLKVAYSLSLADLILAPATPSNTARCAIIAPIVDALAKTINKDDKKLARFLVSNASATNDITAVAFLTGFAGNLALIAIVKDSFNLEIDFLLWFSILSLPALALFLFIPLFLYKIINPTTKKTPSAKLYATKELEKLGKLTIAETKLIFIFITLIVLWVGGSFFSLHATSVAFIGLALLLVFNVLDKNSIKNSASAFETLIWFAILMFMANNLKNLGFTTYVGDALATSISSFLPNANTYIYLFFLLIFYLFASYFFASATAKVLALAPVILNALVGLGVDLELAVFMLAGVSSLGCNLATYTHARNPLLYGFNYHTQVQWMKIGFLISFASFLLFFFVFLIRWSF